MIKTTEFMISSVNEMHEVLIKKRHASRLKNNAILPTLISKIELRDNLSEKEFYANVANYSNLFLAIVSILDTSLACMTKTADIRDNRHNDLTSEFNLKEDSNASITRLLSSYLTHKPVIPTYLQYLLDDFWRLFWNKDYLNKVYYQHESDFSRVVPFNTEMDTYLAQALDRENVIMRPYMPRSDLPELLPMFQPGEEFTIILQKYPPKSIIKMTAILALAVIDIINNQFKD